MLTLPGILEIGSIYISTHSELMDVSLLGTFYLSVYTSSGVVYCNDGSSILLNTVVNCIVKDATNIELFIDYDNYYDIYLAEIFVYDVPDFAQNGLYSMFSSGYEPKLPIMYSVAQQNNVHNNPMSIEIQFDSIYEPIIYIELEREMPGADIFIVSTGNPSRDEKLQVRDLNTQIDCTSQIAVKRYGPAHDTCASTTKMWEIVDVSGQNGIYSVFIDTIAIFPTSMCALPYSVNFQNQYVTVTYIIGSGDLLTPLDLTKLYEPQWCSFTSSNKYKLSTDYYMSGPYTPESGLTLELDVNNDLLINTALSSLDGTNLSLYTSTDENGAGTNLIWPIQIDISFQAPSGLDCSGGVTSLLAIDAIADQQTYVTQSILVSIPIPWDTLSQTYGDFIYCGLKSFKTTDTGSSASPAPYEMTYIENGQFIDLTIMAPDPSFTGSYTVQVEFSLSNFVDVIPVTQNFNVVFCPSVAQDFTIVTQRTPWLVFDVLTSAYTPLTTQVSTYSFNSVCFEYIGFRVYDLSNSADVTIDFVLDELAGTLECTITSWSTFGSQMDYELYIIIGDLSDASTHNEFYLDSFSILTNLADCSGGATSLLAIDAIADQQTYVSQQILVSIPIPWDTLSQSLIDFSHCGPKSFKTTDTGSSASPAPYEMSFIENGQFIDLTIMAPDPSFTGSYIVEVEFSLTNYVDVTPVTQTFNVVFCPSVAQEFTIVTQIAPQLVFDVLTAAYTPLTTQISTYTFNSVCFEYIGFSVWAYQPSYSDVTSDFVLDELAGTLECTITSWSTFGSQVDYDLFIIIGDPSDASTHTEFNLDYFSILTNAADCSSGATSLLAIDAIADQQTYVSQQILISIPIPWDTLSQSLTDFSHCGPKSFKTTDTGSSASPAPYEMSFIENGQFIDLTIMAPDPSFTGSYIVEVEFSLTNYVDVTSVTQTFNVVFCPSVAQEFTIVTQRAPQLIFDVLTAAYTSLTTQISTYSFNSVCFEYIGFRVYDLSNSADVTIDFVHDELAETLECTITSWSTFGSQMDYELYIIIGDLSDASTHNEFYLDSFSILTNAADCSGGATSLLAIDAIADQQIYVTQQILISIPIPWDTLSQSLTDFSHCGPKAFKTTDNGSGASPAPYEMTYIENGQFLDLTIMAPDPSFTGSYTVEVEFSLANYVDVTPVTQTFNVVFCPSYAQDFTIVTWRTPALIFDILAAAYTPLTTQVSSYSFNSVCFDYIGFRVYDLDFYDDYTSDFVYDELAETLECTNTSWSTFGSTMYYDMYIIIGDPSDTSTYYEFYLDTFSILTTSPCDNDPTILTISSVDFVSPISLSLDQSATFTISAPNSLAQSTGDPLVCGLRTTSITVSSPSGQTLSALQLFATESSGETFTLDVVPDATVGTSLFVVTVTTYLTDYPSLPQASIQADIYFNCPDPNFSLVSSAASLAFTHEFYQAVPEMHTYSDYEPIVNNLDCYNLLSVRVIDAATDAHRAQMIYALATDQISIDVFDQSYLPLIGTTQYNQVEVVIETWTEHSSTLSSQTVLLSDQFSVSYTGPANAECYFTTLQTASYTLYYRFGDGVVTTTPLDDPTNSVATAQADPVFCGALDITSADSSLTLTDSPDATWSLSFDGTVVTQAQVGQTLTSTVTFALTDFPMIASINANFDVVVYCPDDGSLIDEATITTSVEMPETSFIYDVSSLVPFQADLAEYQVSPSCQNVTRSYFVHASSFSEVTFITLQEETNTFEVYSEDESLAGTTEQYLWVIDLTDGQVGVQVCAFEIEYTGQNYLPYFNPPISALLQVTKTVEEGSWQYQIPDYFDDNQHDTVSLSVGLANVHTFVNFDDQARAIVIENIADATVIAGTYSIEVRLFDGKETSLFPLTLKIADVEPVPEEDVPEEAEPQEEENVTDENAEGSEATSEETSDEGSEETSESSASAEEKEKQFEINSFVFDWRSAFLKKEKQMRSQGSIFKLEPPKPSLAFIKETGEVVINFSQKMHILPSLDAIKKGQLQVNGKNLPSFEMRVIPAEGQDPSNIEFEWIVSEMTEKQVKLKLLFKKAVFISSQMEPDILEIVFRDRYLFVSMDDLAISDKPLTSERMLAKSSKKDEEDEDFIYLRKVLPQQLQLGGSEEQIQNAVGQASSASQAILASNFLLNIVLAASLQHLWSMINTQQLMVMLPLFQVSMPANAASFFGHIMEIAAFDFYDTTDVIHELFNLEPTEPINDNFSSVGFESMYFLVNMGTMAIFYLVYIILILLSPILSFLGRYSKCIRKRSKRLNKKLYWNDFLTLMNETYMILIVSVLINITVFSTETTGLTVMSSLCALIFGIFIIAPILIIAKLYKRVEKMKSNEYQTSYGALYGGLNLKEGRKVLYYPSFFLIRRVMLGIAICIVGRVFIWQIFIMTAQIITQVIIIGSGVFQLRSKRRTEYFNELMLMFVMYTVICFSPWMSDVIVKFQIGYFTCLIVILHLLVNFAIIFRASYSIMKVNCKKKYALKKYKKQRQLFQTKLKETHEKRKERRAQLREDAQKRLEAKRNAELNKTLTAPAEMEAAKIENAPAESSGFIPSVGLDDLILDDRKIQLRKDNPTFVESNSSSSTVEGVKDKKNQDQKRKQLRFAEPKLAFTKAQKDNLSQIEKEVQVILNLDSSLNSEASSPSEIQQKIKVRVNQIYLETPPEQALHQELIRSPTAKKQIFSKLVQEELMGFRDVLDLKDDQVMGEQSPTFNKRFEDKEAATMQFNSTIQLANFEPGLLQRQNAGRRNQLADHTTQDTTSINIQNFLDKKLKPSFDNYYQRYLVNKEMSRY